MCAKITRGLKPNLIQKRDMMTSGYNTKAFVGPRIIFIQTMATVSKKLYTLWFSHQGADYERK